jgi:hypothetical protein
MLRGDARAGVRVRKEEEEGEVKKRETRKLLLYSLAEF